uniref:Uncharacterized protein n=1 Tax=Arundo donax TaxID=35708 RepID=A0A0A9E3Y4_ARUDO
MFLKVLGSSYLSFLPGSYREGKRYQCCYIYSVRTWIQGADIFSYMHYKNEVMLCSILSCLHVFTIDKAPSH